MTSRISVQKYFVGLTVAFIIISALPVQAAYIRPLVFPVNGVNYFSDSFGDGRSGGRQHEGTDIISSKMTPVVAAIDGRVRYVVDPEATWGYAIVLVAEDDWTFHYLHLNNDTPGTDDGNGGTQNAYVSGITRGAEVFKGQHIGWVGDSGNAEGVGSHLHFEMRDPQGTAINAYESLLVASLPGTLPRGDTSVVTTVVIPRNGILIKYASDPRVFLLANDIKRHIADEYSFNALGFNWLSIATISEAEQYRTGLPIRLVQGVTAVYEDGTPISTENAPVARYIFTKDLALGSRDPEVRELQIVLKTLGYYTYSEITGYYGTFTRDAVLKFQRANGIEAVGYVGPKTRAVLNAL